MATTRSAKPSAGAVKSTMTTTPERKSALQARVRRGPQLFRPLVYTLFATVVIGTLISTQYTTAEITAFRSRLPSATLTHLTRQKGSFPIPSLPFFADKRNFLNQYFVKFSWFWTTAIFIAYSAAAFFSLSSPQPLSRISLNTSPTPFALLMVSIRRYLLATLYWYYLTQSTWFGVSYPSVSKLILRNSGAVCVPAAFGSSEDEFGQCSGSKGEYFKGGHDVSGHAFMMVHSILFIYQLIRPTLPLVFPSMYPATNTQTRQSGTPNTNTVTRKSVAPPAIRVTTFVAIGLIFLWWWMLLMTSLFFHSPAEKISGFAFGLLGHWVSSL